MAAVLVAGCGGSGSSPGVDAAIDAPKLVDAPADVPVDTTDGPVSSVEILTDGDFEQLDGAGFLTHWTRHEGDPNGQIALVTSPVHSGTHAVQWQMSTATGYEMFIIQRDVATAKLEPGATYQITGWYHMNTTAPTTADVAWNYIVRGTPGDEPDIETVSLPAMGPTTANTWLPFHYEFTIPIGAAPQAYWVYLHSIKWGSAVPVTLTVDGASIRKKL
ncbi:MAG: carbohydrate binding domain-containing protein [Deltaproteobacteria bacterium]|nr:carbohydrate binding domain-containing protein [Deltaproteobacteria bacterium]